MERRFFLKALGLIGVVSVIPDELIDISETINSPLRTVTIADIGDTVVLKDGVTTRVVRMDNTKNTPTVTLRPVSASVDLGNGRGCDKEYDKDNLPEITEIVYKPIRGERTVINI